MDQSLLVGINLDSRRPPGKVRGRLFCFPVRIATALILSVIIPLYIPQRYYSTVVLYSFDAQSTVLYCCILTLETLESGHLTDSAVKIEIKPNPALEGLI